MENLQGCEPGGEDGVEERLLSQQEPFPDCSLWGVNPGGH